MHGWIHGHVVPSLPAIVRMAQAFGGPIPDVLLSNEIFPRYQTRFSKTLLGLHAPRRRSGKVN
ncbi:hypothetical protein AB4Z48_05740 [Cupriavidus sp. 2TAF22]|uniref:hypothetical protein n=1 Tax=unclassified Cupriavidus TaxID=2640874 RepID=UPI003F90A2FF